jgi:hypothetical protein
LALLGKRAERFAGCEEGEGMTLTEFMRLLQDLGGIALTVLLIFVAYKIAMLIDTLAERVKNKEEGDKNA